MSWLEEVRAAAVLLEGVATRTPVQDSRALSQIAGVEVWLKCENLQRAGSFKLRGAYVRMARLTQAERDRGVVAASAGNHAQGVALAARMLGIDAIVYMPVDAALPKLAATREYGAEVRLVGTSVDEALVAAHAESERTGAVLIHPYDHRDVVAGQGTVALEILDQVPDVATILVPVGGGGLPQASRRPSPSSGRTSRSSACRQVGRPPTRPRSRRDNPCARPSCTPWQTGSPSGCPARCRST